MHDTPRADRLIARARRGDSAAFRALYEMNVRRVYALSLRLMTDHSEADELTQDVLTAAWRQLNRYRGDALFSAWPHGITVRLARQRARSLLRRRRREGRVAAEYIDAVSMAMPTANLDLEREQAALPHRMRTALILHAVEGYSQAETAALMGIA